MIMISVRYILLLLTAICLTLSCSPSAKTSTPTVSDHSENTTKIAITGPYWKLTELMGKPITEYSFHKVPFILIGEDMRVTGSGGCNTLNGSVKIKDGFRISFGPIATTLMACQNVNTEALLLDVLKLVDNYSINDRQLLLNRARMAPLARFEAVEKK